MTKIKQVDSWIIVEQALIKHGVKSAIKLCVGFELKIKPFLRWTLKTVNLNHITGSFQPAYGKGCYRGVNVLGFDWRLKLQLTICLALLNELLIRMDCDFHLIRYVLKIRWNYSEIRLKIALMTCLHCSHTLLSWLACLKLKSAY